MSNERPASTFTPADPGFRSRVEDSFARQKAMKQLQLSLARVEPGLIELTMPFQESITQQHGFVHAGILATALDTACGYAAFSLMPDDAAVLSVEFKINLLAPARGEHFRFIGQVLRPGRTITVCQAEAIAYGGGSSKVVAVMTGTMMAVFGREGIKH